MSSWQPFRTAPRDRTHFIVCTATRIVGEAYWDPEDGELWWANTDKGDYYGEPVNEPRLWQPMPAAPEEIR